MSGNSLLNQNINVGLRRYFINRLIINLFVRLTQSTIIHSLPNREILILRLHPNQYHKCLV